MYIIITYRILPENNVEDYRAPGVFRHLEAAHHRVMDNACDIFEIGYYNYALILKIKDGIYPSTEEIQWYYYSNDAVCTVSRPDGLHNLPTIIG